MSEGRDLETDEELLAKITAGNKSAYSVLVQRYLNKVWRLAISILRNELEAEDAVQEVFLTLWQSLDKWDHNGSAKLSTWIYRVAFNKCIDIKRKRRDASDADEIDIASDEDSAFTKTAQAELSEKMSDLMRDLPDKQRIALLMYYYEELSVEEISTKLDKSEQSVRSLLKRGRATLKDKIKYDPAFQSWDISGISGHLWR